MPDLAQLLSSLGDSGAKIFSATVDDVTDGSVTIRANGGTFTKVPYLPSGFYPALNPEIGDACYVIGQENWGMLVLGRPATGDVEPLPDPSLFQLDAVTLARWNPGSWTVSTTGYSDIQPGGSQAAAFFYNFNTLTSDQAAAIETINQRGLSTAAIFLAVPGFVQGEVAHDTTPLNLALHNSGSPLTNFYPVAGNPVWFDPYEGFAAYYSIPLDWATKLIQGQAHGIYVTSDRDVATVGGPGTLRFTSL